MSYPFLMLRKNVVIEKFIRRTDNIIYGARAMNVQVAPGLQRMTFDYDLYSKKPRVHATLLEQRMDKIAGGDFFYMKEAMHKGTFKVMDKGRDRRMGTKDDFGIADFTRPNRKIRTIRVQGIRYASLSERKKDIKISLSNPLFAFRHEKDKMDRFRIKVSGKIRGLFG